MDIEIGFLILWQIILVELEENSVSLIWFSFNYNYLCRKTRNSSFFPKPLQAEPTFFFLKKLFFLGEWDLNFSYSVKKLTHFLNHIIVDVWDIPPSVLLHLKTLFHVFSHSEYTVIWCRCCVHTFKLICEWVCFLFLSPLWCHLQQLVEHGYNCQRCTPACLCSVAAWECPWQRDGWQQAVFKYQSLPHSQHP